MSYETSRQRCNGFGRPFARRTKARLSNRGTRWLLDGRVVSIGGNRRYPVRVIDQNGAVLGILVHTRKDTRAAKRFFRKLLKRQGNVSLEITTDKLGSYVAAKRDIMAVGAQTHCPCRRYPEVTAREGIAAGAAGASALT